MKKIEQMVIGKKRIIFLKEELERIQEAFHRIGDDSNISLDTCDAIFNDGAFKIIQEECEESYEHLEMAIAEVEGLLDKMDENNRECLIFVRDK